jgi:hypothetical protein
MNQKILIGAFSGHCIDRATIVAIHHHKASAASKDSSRQIVPVNQLLQEAAKL